MTTLHPGGTGPSDSREFRHSRATFRDHVTHELFCLARSLDSEPDRAAVLSRIIAMHLDQAHAAASRYRCRGVALDDLHQVAALALVRATHNFDPTLGHQFLSYAIPTIRGELRKHFRDHGWMIRPPRRVQELLARIRTAETDLTQQLGRSPLPREVADLLGEHEESVLEALASNSCFLPASLDHHVASDTTDELGDTLSTADDGNVAAEARIMLHPVLRDLPERDRDILRMRFFEDLTQPQIATRIGVTQVTVSRQLARILTQLRSTVGEVTTG